MRKNCDFAVSVNILTPFVRHPFFLGFTTHYVCLDHGNTLIEHTFFLLIEHTV